MENKQQITSKHDFVADISKGNFKEIDNSKAIKTAKTLLKNFSKPSEFFTKNNNLLKYEHGIKRLNDTLKILKEFYGDTEKGFCKFVQVQIKEVPDKNKNKIRLKEINQELTEKKHWKDLERKYGKHVADKVYEVFDPKKQGLPALRKRWQNAVSHYIWACSQHGNKGNEESKSTWKTQKKNYEEYMIEIEKNFTGEQTLKELFQKKITTNPV